MSYALNESIFNISLNDKSIFNYDFALLEKSSRQALSAQFIERDESLHKKRSSQF